MRKWIIACLVVFVAVTTISGSLPARPYCVMCYTTVPYGCTYDFESFMSDWLCGLCSWGEDLHCYELCDSYSCLGGSSIKYFQLNLSHCGYGPNC